MRKIDARFCCFEIEQRESPNVPQRHAPPRVTVRQKKEQPARGEPAVLM
jgi:hypothetical protein